MKVAILFFGIVRDISLPISSILENIIKPNTNNGISFTSLASINMLDVIHNPRSRELNSPINSADCLRLGADYYLLSNQNDINIADEFYVAKTHEDAYNDDYKSVRNLLHQLASLRRGWRALELLEPAGFDAYLFLRPDIAYADLLNIHELWPYIRDPNSILIPAWHSWSGFNDRFALAGPTAGRCYSLRFDRVKEYCRSNRLHAEHFLAWTLAQESCSVGELPMRARRVRSHGEVVQEDFGAARLSMPRQPTRFTFSPVQFFDAEPKNCEQRSSVQIGNPERLLEMSNPMRRIVSGFNRLSPLPGLHYQDFLQQLHQALGPIRYLEIGTQHGDSLRHAKGRAVAIDPNFLFKTSEWSASSDPTFFEMTSDDYFANHDPRERLGGPIDVAFIDGMHLWEFVLRDFNNVEKFCSPDGIVILHDCLPQNFEMTERTRRPSERLDRELANAWTGDVWRVLPELRRLRPDLRIEVLDCPPTGLVIIRDLDATSEIIDGEIPELTTAITDAEPSENEFWKFIDGLQLTSSQSWLVENVGALIGVPRAGR